MDQPVFESQGRSLPPPLGSSFAALIGIAPTIAAEKRDWSGRAIMIDDERRIVVETPIGKPGGQGTAFKARVEFRGDPDRVQRIALKVFHSAFTGTQGDLAKEQIRRREIATGFSGVARAEFDGVEIIGDRAFPWVAYEWVEGESFAHYVKHREAASGAQRLEMAKSAARALERLHALGFTHNDVKPGNIIWRTLGNVPPHAVFIDCDLLQYRSRGSAFAGTSKYMSPARHAGCEPDHPDDVFALSLSIVELLAGDAPTAVLGKGQDPKTAPPVQPDKLFNLPKALPSDVADVLAKGLDPVFDPNFKRRYADAGAFARDLDDALTFRPLSSRAPAPVLYKGRRFVRRNRISVSLAALAMFVLAVLLPTLAMQRSWGLEQAARAATEGSTARAMERHRASDLVGAVHEYVNALRFARPGSSDDRVLRGQIWAVRTQLDVQPDRVVPGPPSRVTTAAFSADGRVVFCAESDGTIRRIDLGKGTRHELQLPLVSITAQLTTTEGQHPSGQSATGMPPKSLRLAVQQLATSADGGIALALQEGGFAWAINLASGEVRPLAGVPTGCWESFYRPQMNLVGALVPSTNGGEPPKTAVVISPQDHPVVSLAPGGTRAFDFASRANPGEIRVRTPISVLPLGSASSPLTPRSVVISPSGDFGLLHSREAFMLLDLRSHPERVLCTGRAQMVSEARFIGEHCVLSMKENDEATLSVIEPGRTQRTVLCRAAHESPVYVTASPVGDRLAWVTFHNPTDSQDPGTITSLRGRVFQLDSDRQIGATIELGIAGVYTGIDTNSGAVTLLKDQPPEGDRVLLPGVPMISTGSARIVAPPRPPLPRAFLLNPSSWPCGFDLPGGPVMVKGQSTGPGAQTATFVGWRHQPPPEDGGIVLAPECPLHFSRDGLSVVTVDNNFLDNQSTVRVINTADGTVRTERFFADTMCFAAGLLDDNATLAVVRHDYAAAEDASLVTLIRSDGTVLAEHRTTGFVTQAASQDGGLSLLTSKLFLTRLSTTPASSALAITMTPLQGLNTFTSRFTPRAGSLVAAHGSTLSTVHCWPVLRSGPSTPLESAPESIINASDGRHAMALTASGMLHIISLETNNPVRPACALNSPVRSLAFSPDGLSIVAATGTISRAELEPVRLNFDGSVPPLNAERDRAVSLHRWRIGDAQSERLEALICDRRQPPLLFAGDSAVFVTNGGGVAQLPAGNATAAAQVVADRTPFLGQLGASRKGDRLIFYQVPTYPAGRTVLDLRDPQDRRAASHVVSVFDRRGETLESHPVFDTLHAVGFDHLDAPMVVTSRRAQDSPVSRLAITTLGPSPREFVREVPGAVVGGLVAGHRFVLIMSQVNANDTQGIRASVSLRVFDLAGQMSDWTLQADPASFGASMSNNGERMLVMNARGRVDVYERGLGETPGFTFLVQNLTAGEFSPDGTAIAIGDNSGTIQVFPLLYAAGQTGHLVNAVESLTLRSRNTDGTLDPVTPRRLRELTVTRPPPPVVSTEVVTHPIK